MKLMVMTGIYILLKNWWNAGNINRRERDKRNELSTKYNREVNIIGVIDNCLGVTAIGLDITGVGLLLTIAAAPDVIGSSINCYGITSSGRKSSYLKDVVENRKTWKDCDVSCLTLPVVSFQKH